MKEFDLRRRSLSSLAGSSSSGCTASSTSTTTAESTATGATSASSTTEATASTSTTATAVSSVSEVASLLLSALAVALEQLGVECVGGADQVGLLPQIGGQEAVGLGEGVEGGAGEVLDGLGLAGGRGEHVLHSGETENLLGDGRSDDAGSSGGGDESHGGGAALAVNLAGHGVGLSDSVAPVAASDGDEVALGGGDSASDGQLHFLGELHAHTDVAVSVTDGHHGLEAGALAGLGLLLHGLDFHGVVLEFLSARFHDLVDDLSLLDGEGVSVDEFEVVDLLKLD